MRSGPVSFQLELTPEVSKQAKLTRPTRGTTAGWTPSAAAGQPATARPSMAETLRATFGSGAERLPGGAAQRVDAAYAKFRSFGL